MLTRDQIDAIPDQPDGIEDDRDMPDPARAAERILSYVEAMGDGLYDVAGGNPLYGRDLESLARAAKKLLDELTVHQQRHAALARVVGTVPGAWPKEAHWVAEEVKNILDQPGCSDCPPGCRSCTVDRSDCECYGEPGMLLVSDLKWLLEELAIAEKHIERGNDETMKAWGEVRARDARVLELAEQVATAHRGHYLAMAKKRRDGARHEAS